MDDALRNILTRAQEAVVNVPAASADEGNYTRVVQEPDTPAEPVNVQAAPDTGSFREVVDGVTIEFNAQPAEETPAESHPLGPLGTLTDPMDEVLRDVFGVRAAPNLHDMLGIGDASAAHQPTIHVGEGIAAQMRRSVVVTVSEEVPLQPFSHEEVVHNSWRSSDDEEPIVEEVPPTRHTRRSRINSAAPLTVEQLTQELEVNPTEGPDSPEASQEGAESSSPRVNPNPDVLVNDETLRFSAAAWFQKAQEQIIILAGVGGIGSWISFLLAKLHPRAMYLYDPDTVELVNLAGQLYSSNDVGKYKVDALCDTIANYTGYRDIFSYPTRYADDSLVGDIMFCGFDNMPAREYFYRRWHDHVMSLPEDRRHQCLFIDGRLTAEELQILALTGNDEYYMKQYEERFLFTDAEAVQEVCSFKQTAFMANMIGALVVNIFVNFCANLVGTGFPRSIPFFTQYTAETMFMSIEK